MAESLKVRVTGDTIGVEKSLNTLKENAKYLSAELNNVEEQLKLDPSNLQLMTKYTETLTEKMGILAQVEAKAKEEAGKMRPTNNRELTQLSRTVKAMAEAQKEAVKTQAKLASMTKQAERLRSAASTFRFDAGNGPVEFQNSLAGVQAALSSIRKVSDLVKFDAGSASARELRDHISQTTGATDLLLRKAGLIQQELKDIDPRVDPTGFERLQRELSETSSALTRLRQHQENLGPIASRLDIDTSQLQNSVRDINSVMNNATGQIADVTDASMSNIAQRYADGFRSVSARIREGVQQIGSGLGSGLRGALSGVTRIGATVFRGLSSSLVTGARLTGTVALKAITTSLSGVGKGVVTSLKALSRVATTAGRTVFDGLGNVLSAGLKGAINTVTGLARTGFSKIGNVMSGTLRTVLQGSLLRIGSDIVQGTQRLISDVAGQMQSTVVASKQLQNILEFSNVDDSQITKITEQMQNFAKATSFSSASLNAVVGGLAASGVQADRLGDYTENIAKTYALLGDGSRDIADIGKIFGQINSLGRLQAQDFNQLKDAGIGGAIKQQIERDFPDIIKQFGGFTQAMQQSKISAEMVEQAVAAIGTSDSAVKATTVPKTLKASYDILTETIAQKFAGTFDTITQRGIKFVQNITKHLDGISADGLNATVMGSFDRLTNTASSVFGMILRYGPTVMGVVSDSIRSTISTLQLLFNTFGGPIISALQVIMSAVGNFTQTVSGGLLGAFSPLAGAINNLIGTIASSFVTVGNALTGPVTGAISALPPIINLVSSAISGIASAVGPVISVVYQLGSAISNVLIGNAGNIGSLFGSAISILTESFNRLLPVITTIINSVVSLATTIGSVFATQFGSSIGPVIGLLELLGNAFANILGYISNNIQNIVNVFKPVADVVLELSGVLLGSLGGAISQLSGPLFNLFGSITSTVGQLSGVVSEVFTGMVNDSVGPLNQLMDVVSGLLPALVPAISGIAQALGSMWRAIATVIGSLAAPIARLLVPFAKMVESSAAITGKLFEALVPAITALIGPVESVLGVVLGAMEKAYSFVANLDFSGLSNILTTVATTIGTVIESLFGMGSVVTEATGPLAYLFDMIREATEVLFPNMGAAMGDAFNGLKTLIQPILDTVKVVFDSIILAVAAVIDVINGIDFSFLTRIFEDLMGLLRPVIDFVKELFAGFNDGMTALKESGVLDDLSSALTRIGDALADIIHAVVELLRPAFEWLVDFVSKNLGPAFEFLGRVFTVIVTILADMVELFADVFTAITDVVAEIGKWFSDGLDEFMSWLGYNDSGLSYSAPESISNYASSKSNTYNNNITINAPAEMNVHALAREVFKVAEHGLV